MSNLRPFPIDGNTSAHLANAANVSNTHHLTAGSGIKINHTSQGVHISATGNLKKDPASNLGAYNFNQEYFPNDMVYVDPNTAYKDENGAAFDFTNLSGSLPTITGGFFVCQVHIPPGNADEDAFSDTLSAYGGTVPSDMAQSYRWYDYNVYYPIYPLIPSASAVVVSVDGGNVVANQNFWLPYSPQIPLTMCVNGSSQVAYINGVVSGSHFNMSQLPYVP